MSAERTRTSTLRFVGQVSLPAHGHGGFDHGDVHLPTGRVFVAHTANGTVEVMDGQRRTLEQTLPGCPEASGDLSAHGATDFVVEEVTTEEGAHTTAFDSQRHRRYVFLPKSCQAAVYQETVAVSQ